MRTVTPVDSAVRAYGQVWQRRRVLIQLATIPTMGMVVAGMVGARLDGIGSVGTLVGLLCQMVVAVLVAVVIIGWVRAVQGGFGEVRPVALASPTPAEINFLFWYVGLAVLPSFAVSLVASVALGPAAAGLGRLLVALAVLYVQLRLSFYYIELALGRAPAVGQAVATTGPLVWPMFGATLLALIPVTVAAALLALAFGPGTVFGGSLGLAVIAIAQGMLSAVGAALVASVGMGYWQSR